LPSTSFAKRSASPDGLQNYCRACSSAVARARRPRKQAEAPEVDDGWKWCRRCDTVKPLDEFPRHRGTRDGRQTYCRDCFADLYRARRAREGHITRPAGVPPGYKFCRGCQQVRPLTAYTPRDAAPDGYQFRCRDCMSRRDRKRHLASKYGLTIEDVSMLLDQQAGTCIICLRAPAVHVDHDHATGEVRGMLCFRCNAALGQLGDDPARVRRAADYLEGWRLLLRRTKPAGFEIVYRAPATAETPATRSAGTRPQLDITALRAAAMRGTA
jgi:hypothetical protein